MNSLLWFCKIKMNKQPERNKVTVDLSFVNFDVMTFEGEAVCKLMKHINIRGHQCSNCTAPRWGVRSKWSLQIDTSEAVPACQFDAREDAVYDEDNFGFYVTTNSNFLCTSSADSTTNFWFGGYY